MLLGKQVYMIKQGNLLAVCEHTSNLSPFPYELTSSGPVYMCYMHSSNTSKWHSSRLLLFLMGSL